MVDISKSTMLNRLRFVS